MARSSLLFVSGLLSLAGCFSKPRFNSDANTNSDGVLNDGERVDAGPCARPPISPGFQFAQLRNGAVLDVDGDTRDDFVVYGDVGGMPHWWLYKGSIYGQDLNCPDEQVALPAYNSIGAVLLDKFGAGLGHYADLVLAGEKNTRPNDQGLEWRSFDNNPVTRSIAIQSTANPSWGDDANHTGFLTMLRNSPRYPTSEVELYWSTGMEVYSRRVSTEVGDTGDGSKTVLGQRFAAANPEPESSTLTLIAASSSSIGKTFFTTPRAATDTDVPVVPGTANAWDPPSETIFVRRVGNSGVTVRGYIDASATASIGTLGVQLITGPTIVGFSSPLPAADSVWRDGYAQTVAAKVNLLLLRQARSVGFRSASLEVYQPAGMPGMTMALGQTLNKLEFDLPSDAMDSPIFMVVGNFVSLPAVGKLAVRVFYRTNVGSTNMLCFTWETVSAALTANPCMQ